MKTLMILFPLTAGLVWLLTSMPYIACLAGVIVAGMAASAAIGMCDHISTQIRRCR